MSYVLENISKNDREKVLNDARHDSLRYGVLEYAIRARMNEFPGVWAIDRARDSYLYRAPSVVREDSTKMRFSFFYEGIFYDVFVPIMFGNEVDIKCSKEMFETLRLEISSALSVFGRGGNGASSMDESIDPTFQRVE